MKYSKTSERKYWINGEEHTLIKLKVDERVRLHVAGTGNVGK